MKICYLLGVKRSVVWMRAECADMYSINDARIHCIRLLNADTQRCSKSCSQGNTEKWESYRIEPISKVTETGDNITRNTLVIAKF